MLPQSVNFNITFSKMFSPDDYGRWSSRGYRIVSNISWEEGNKICLQRRADSLFSFSDYADLTKKLNDISRRFIDMDMPIFVGARAIENVSISTVSNMIMRPI